MKFDTESSWLVKDGELLARDTIEELHDTIAELAEGNELLRQQLIATDPTDAQELIRKLRSEIVSLNAQVDSCMGQLDVVKGERNEAIRRQKAAELELKRIKKEMKK